MTMTDESPAGVTFTMRHTHHIDATTTDLRSAVDVLMEFWQRGGWLIEGGNLTVHWEQEEADR